MVLERKLRNVVLLSIQTPDIFIRLLEKYCSLEAGFYVFTHDGRSTT